MGMRDGHRLVIRSSDFFARLGSVVAVEALEELPQEIKTEQVSVRLAASAAWMHGLEK